MSTAATLVQERRALPVRAGLRYRQFAAEHLLPNQPAVLSDGVRSWPAVGKWTPEFFRLTYPKKSISIYNRAYSMADFIDLVEKSAPEQPAPYFRNEQVRQVFPELLADLLPVPPYIQPNWLRGPFPPSEGREAEIYIGGCGRSFPFLHYDAFSTHAFLAQIHGVKEVVLYSPEDTPFMYAKDRPRHHSQISDITNVDPGKFPLFAKATAYHATLEPGNLLFIPSRWWHTARMLSPSITVSYNVANRSNWARVRDELLYDARYGHPLRPPVMAVYLTLLGWGHRLADLLPGVAP